MVKGRVLWELTKEAGRQVGRGGIDRDLLFQAVLGSLMSQGVEVPLALQLMIRNVVALERLLERYGGKSLVEIWRENK